MTRRDRPGALPVPERPPTKGDFSHSGQWAPYVAAWEPFYCHAIAGKGIRNGQWITRRGWYYCTPMNLLCGPFLSKAAARGEANEVRVAGEALTASQVRER